MRARLIWMLAGMVVLPMLLVIALGIRGVRDEARLRQAQIEDLLRSRLGDIDARIQELLNDLGSQLVELTDDAATRDASALRALRSEHPFIDNIFVQSADGRMLHPPIGSPISEAERAFLRRTRLVFEEELLLDRAQLTADRRSSRQIAGPLTASPQPFSWYAWYWDSGVHLLFWRSLPDGSIAGCEINRMRLLAEILDLLSEISRQHQGAGDAFALLDSRDRILYASSAVFDATAPSLEMALDHPLASWRLVLNYPQQSATPASMRLARVLVLSLVAFGLGGLAFLFYRESTRELREAAERVNFVNQVSHELRTPLTNIRLYAELLEEDLADEDERTRSRLDVIVAESNRLSRLIGNVLTFGRRQRRQLRLRPRPTRLAPTLRSIVERFRPALASKGIEIEVDTDPELEEFELPLDPDALEQIVGNLLNNIEKYAQTGGWARLSVSRDGSELVVIVEDRGPGIPADRRDEVFEPFVRLKNALTEGVSGTGIGLNLARDLARLHGGDLQLVEAEEGAVFELRFPIQGRTV